jgi:undecaprenyl-diphosphatase
MTAGAGPRSVRAARLLGAGWRWLWRRRRLGLPWLLLAGVLTGAGWGFLEIADEVTEGTLQSFDESVLLAFRSAEDPGDPWGPWWLERAARDYTALGGAPVLLFLVVGVVGFLFLLRKWRMGLAVLAAVLGGWGFNVLLKLLFDRPRPDLVPRLVEVASASFPSGHAMVAATTYLTLAALLMHVAPAYRVRAFVLSLGGLLTIVIGTSRVYLGVHWPSDVLAGWAAGTVWAVLCSAAAIGLRRRGVIPHGEVTRQADDLDGAEPPRDQAWASGASTSRSPGASRSSTSSGGAGSATPGR